MLEMLKDGLDFIRRELGAVFEVPEPDESVPPQHPPYHYHQLPLGYYQPPSTPNYPLPPTAAPEASPLPETAPVAPAVAAPPIPAPPVPQAAEPQLAYPTTAPETQASLVPPTTPEPALPPQVTQQQPSTPEVGPPPPPVPPPCKLTRADGMLAMLLESELSKLSTPPSETASIANPELWDTLESELGDREPIVSSPVWGSLEREIAVARSVERPTPGQATVLDLGLDVELQALLAPTDEGDENGEL
ncbi:hypothetical protein KR51_00029730 [Rubidibacter lacunae KORDI 51-2]|uniref:Uncharacterized protein n=1 Tax=Rubidibacter lacunae KORDI 51-2 TaxID=582515 RepID=U5DGL9_9CHRO|nr:hypothetical protein [Rubidibacter lacunae]ERN40432.1 hypothetical protein KR51_00029730 [Rubidibacter lacunae KORDI 51-2]